MSGTSFPRRKGKALRPLFALTVALCLAATAGSAGVGREAVEAETLLPAGPAGGAKYFFCILGQTLKVGGLITMQPEVVLVGAIVGGVSCGLGW